MDRTRSRPSRRQFVQGVGVAGLGLLAGCVWLPFQGTSHVRQPSRVTRIGFLSTATPDGTTELTDAFRSGLADYGYVEGRNIAIEWRFAEGERARTPTLAAELIALEAAVIVVAGTPDAQVVREATSTIPIVVAGAGGDPISAGLAQSFARPGGNVTGLSNPSPIRGKSIQLLTEAVPGISRVAILSDASLQRLPTDFTEGVTVGLGVQILFLPVARPDELDTAFAAATREGADGLHVVQGPLTVAQRNRIIAFAAEHRLPATYGRRVFVDDGGLMSYQPRISELFRRAAYYVDRILKGARPADLPVEQPREFEFVINLKTAQALGLTIPPHVLLQATEVLQ